MSGRLLRKVLREQELKPKDVDPEIDAEDYAESPVSAAPSRNPFDLLDDQVRCLRFFMFCSVRKHD